MEITHRTFFRHAALFVLPVSLLFLLYGKGRLFSWAILHAPFLILWIICSAGLGTLAHFLAGRPLQKFFLALFSAVSGTPSVRLYRRRRKSRAPVSLDLLLTWASCSRCVAWWWGGGFSFLTHFFYWNRGRLDFPLGEQAALGILTLLGAPLFFGLLGSSLSATLAVGLYLKRRVRESREEENKET